MLPHIEKQICSNKNEVLMKWVKRTNINDIEKLIFSNLGVSCKDELNAWFKKFYNNEYCIKGLDEAVALAKNFINQRVTIVGDYDCDGVTSTTILVSGLKEYGFKNVTYRIPKRFSEGFGISPTIIDEIDSGLIITCDNGIAGLEAIEKAKEKGLTVIVTDHHQPVIKDGIPVYPPADIIIDPNAISNSADFNGYCGAGIAYKFICQLFNNRKDIKYRYLPYAAIGTVADVMQLVEENYVFVKLALDKKLIGSSFSTIGLQALCNVLGLNKISEDDIAFRIGPAINAASRMIDDGASLAVELLLFDGGTEAAISKAEIIKGLNEQRKTIEAETFKKAQEIIEFSHLEKACPLVLYIPGVAEGVIGIIAGRCAEHYHVPALVFTDSESAEGKCLKGSARSYGNYNVKEAFDRNSSLFIRYGGHKGAAGMSIIPEALQTLSKSLSDDDIAHGYQYDDNLYYDLAVTEDTVEKCLDILSRFHPYGEGNPEPVVMLPFKPIIKYGNYRRILGQTGTTIKINGSRVDAISFSLAHAFKNIDEKAPLKIIGKLSYNEYNGNKYPQIEIIDFKEEM